MMYRWQFNTVVLIVTVTIMHVVSQVLTRPATYVWYFLWIYIGWNSEYILDILWKRYERTKK